MRVLRASGSILFAVIALTGSVRTGELVTAFTPAATAPDASEPVTAENIVVNGSFETPPLPPAQTHEEFVAPASVGEWTVESGAIDFVRSYWASGDGAQSVDLTGCVPGALYQDLTTVPGQRYALSFQMAGNVGGPPVVKSMEVFWGDLSLGVFRFDTTGHTFWQMGWETRAVASLVATTTSTRLKFVGLDEVSCGGMALDDVRVVEGDLAQLRVSPSTVAGCLNATGKVSLAAPAPAAGTLVTLASSNSHAVVPTAVVVRPGQLSKSFPIRTTTVISRQAAIISASTGEGGLSATLTLRPIGPKAVTLLPNPVVGGSDSLGTVRLECPAAPGDITVALSSTKPAIAQPASASVTVPAGEQAVPFTVMTNPVFVTSRPAIKATANGVTKSKALVVNPTP